MLEISNLILDLVLANAFVLIKEKGTTTTLEVKNRIREKHPNLFIQQEMVSTALILFQGDDYLDYTDNGIYRTYFLASNNEEEDTEISTPTEQCVSLIEALEILNELQEGDNLTITFIKLNNEERTIEGFVKTPNRGLGIMLMHDINIMDNNNIRQVNLRKLISFVLDGVTYTVKKK